MIKIRCGQDQGQMRMALVSTTRKLYVWTKLNVEQTLKDVSPRHNQVRDTTANSLKIICNDINIEPSSLISPSGKSLSERTNIKSSARVDPRATGFWIAGQKAFLAYGFSIH